MKKGKKLILTFVFIVLAVFLAILIHAQSVDNPTEGIKDSTGGILDEEGLHTGNITTSISPIKSKAEERIDAINKWLENNASWFKLVFSMVPELSWLFAIVLYFWLLFFVNLVLNGSIFGIIISNKNYARLMGLVLFVLLLVPMPPAYGDKGNLGIIPRIGNIAYDIADWTYNKFLPYGIAIAVVLLIILIIILVVLAIFAPQVLLAIKKWRDERREKQRKEEQETNQKALKKLVEGATGQKSQS